MQLPGTSRLSPRAPVVQSNRTNRQTHKTSQRRPRQRKTFFVYWSFVGPLMLGLIIFVYIPIIWGMLLSFFSARGTVTPDHFVGLQNYASMLSDPAFIQSLVTFTIFALFIVPTTFCLSLALALLINTTPFGQGFFRTVIFLPTACSYVVASMVWKISLFNGLPYGVANMLLGIFHQAPIAWIATANPPWYWLVLVTVRLWLQAGFYMIIFLAGLQDVPHELYESAFIDGARRGWTTFRAITLPHLRETAVAVLLLNLIAAFQAFAEFYNILGGYLDSGGNQILARPPLVYLYDVAFSDQSYGRGSAGALILTFIIILFTVIQGRLFGFGQSSAS